MKKRFILFAGCTLPLLLVSAQDGWSQRIHLPQTRVSNQTALQGSGTRDGLVPVPQTSGSASSGGGPITLGQPSFDPYAANSGDNADVAPSLQGSSTRSFPGTSSQIPGSPPTGSGGFPCTGFPAASFPQQPPALFPNGIGDPHPGWPQAQPGPYLRFFQDLRVRYSWLPGDSEPDEMDIHDVELATTVNFPNFLWSGQPLQVSPVFAFHFWAGPETDPVLFPTELPSQVYSSYGSFHWQPMITPMFGADLELNVGVFSDYSSVTSDSVRVFGTGVALLALTPTVSVKAGVNYLDRVDLKILPAGGILWTPNPQTKFDIFFPKPKLSQYLTTLGNSDVWWYLFGEYGGGSWTVDRAVLVGGDFEEHMGDPRVDVNDIRIGIGAEWTGEQGLRGFLEVAYVFDREIVFASGSPDRSLDDTVMLRTGIAY